VLNKMAHHLHLGRIGYPGLVFITLLLSACSGSKTVSEPNNEPVNEPVNDPVSNPTADPLQSISTYRLTTDFQGDDRALSVVDMFDANATQNNSVATQLRLRDVANLDQQRWVFTKLDDGRYTISNQSIGDSYSIDVVNDGVFNQIKMAPTADVSGQYWTITPKSNGYCQLTNSFTGTEIALDIRADGEQDEPMLATNGDFSGQSWRFTPNGGSASTDETLMACFEMQATANVPASNDGSSLPVTENPTDPVQNPTNLPEPTESPATESILANGGFESGISDWSSCADTGATETSTDASQGSLALVIKWTDCLFQEFAVTPDATYTLRCDAKTSGYTGITFSVTDSEFNKLDTQELTVNGSTYQSYTTSITAPAAATLGSVTIYSEGVASVDACALVVDGATTPPESEPEPPVENSLLVNGDFESGTNDWFSCADTGITEISTDASTGSSALAISGADCLFQEFAIKPDATYTVQCDAKAKGFSSISLSTLDSDYNTLDSQELTINGNAYQSYKASITAPTAGAIGAVTFYSEGEANIDGCSVVEQS